MAKGKRVGDIDFWRGAVLITILVDHIPGNLLELLTPRNFGFSDSSEAFVFISGVSVGMVYGPRARARGILEVTRACLRRALKLYWTHIALSAAALVIFAFAFALSGSTELVEAHGRGLVFGAPGEGLPGVAVLSHQLGYFNILPLYIVLMVWAPLALALAMRDIRWALAASLGLYVASRGFGVHLPNWPEPGAWFFNPFAWQLDFTIGLVAAIVWRNGPPRADPGLVYGSVTFLAVAALVATDGAGGAPGLRDAVFSRFDVAKQDLGLVRLVHFVALAYLVAVAPQIAPQVKRLFASAPAEAVRRLGRNSLAIFAAGCVISALAQATTGAMRPHASVGIEEAAGLAYTAAGVAALFIVARWIECRNAPTPSSSGAAPVGAA